MQADQAVHTRHLFQLVALSQTQHGQMFKAVERGTQADPRQPKVQVAKVFEAVPCNVTQLYLAGIEP